MIFYLYSGAFPVVWNRSSLCFATTFIASMQGGQISIGSQALVLKDFTHLLEVRNLDVGGDVDLADAKRHGFADLLVRVVGAAVQDKR